MNTSKRILRVLCGLLFAAVFAVFGYASYNAAPNSEECTGYDSNYLINTDYGCDRLAYLERVGREYTFTDKKYLKDMGWLTDTAGSSDTAVTDAEPVSVPSDSEISVEETAAQTAAVSDPEPSAAALKARSLGLPDPPEIDVSEWQYLLVNANHPLDPVDYAPNLAYLNMTASETDIQTAYNDQRCAIDERIAQPLLDFALGCKEAGYPVYLSSGYRSYADQNYLYQRKVSQGYSEEVAKTIVAYPGTSEHQTGLSCDITDYYRETKDSSLAQTDTYKWLCEHCAEYGFVVRYPEDKSGSADSITGIIYEPWHFRYVGVEAATYMTENNLCLEEFLELYEA